MPSSGQHILQIRHPQDEQRGEGLIWSEIGSVEVIWWFDHMGGSRGAPHLTHQHCVLGTNFVW